MADGWTGGCLCAVVRHEVSCPAEIVGDCYREDCRRASGTSHRTHARVPKAAFAATGDVRFFDTPADSGNMVSRGFCPTCGSAVHSLNSGMPEMVLVRVSSLDDPDAVAPGMTVYASRAPSWARLDTNCPVFREMPERGVPAAS